MATSRTHTSVPRKKTKDYHGYCDVAHVSRGVGMLASANFEITFEEAMKLSLALQSALLQMNTYNRSTTTGRQIRIQLSYKQEHMSVNEVTVPIVRRS